MNAVTWFEIPVTDLSRAKTFYEHVLTTQLTHMEMGPAAMEMFPAQEDAPGSGGALVLTEGYMPSRHGTIVYLTVSDIEAALERVKANGGSTLVKKLDIGEFGFIGHFEDCEGNRVGL